MIFRLQIKVGYPIGTYYHLQANIKPFLFSSVLSLASTSWMGKSFFVPCRINLDLRNIEFVVPRKSLLLLFFIYLSFLPLFILPMTVTSLDSADINFGVLSEYLDRIKGAFDVVKHVKTTVTDGNLHSVGPLKGVPNHGGGEGLPCNKANQEEA